MKGQGNQVSPRPYIWPAASFGLILLAGLALAWLAHDAPLAPGRARGWLQADALSALALISLGGLGMAARPATWREVAAALVFALATAMGHLALAAALIAAGGALSAWGRQPRVLGSLATLAVALGLVAVGVATGEWRYGAPGAGAGLSSPAFALVLIGALLAGGASDVARGRPPEASPLAAVACLYALLRLFSLGPWNLGWLLAALLTGTALALGAAWQAAAAPPAQTRAWVGCYLCGLAIVGAGLGSGAGVTLAGYALLLWPIVALGLADANVPRAARLLLGGAAPLSAPFVLAWMAVGAAVAGGLTTLAAALWLAALLLAAAVARGAAVAAWGRVAALAAALSAGLGLGAPLAVAGLLAPAAAQLQGGLTPFGEIALWPWAGLLALDAARQPVATFPSLALAALMLILAALCWVALRIATRK